MDKVEIAEFTEPEASTLAVADDEMRAEAEDDFWTKAEEAPGGRAQAPE